MGRNFREWVRDDPSGWKGATGYLVIVIGGACLLNWFFELIGWW